jgi:hypothetical protein
MNDISQRLTTEEGIIYEIEDDTSDEEEREFAEVNASIYGSAKDGYFEIDYFIGDTSCELYINIVEKEIN